VDAAIAAKGCGRLASVVVVVVVVVMVFDDEVRSMTSGRLPWTFADMAAAEVAAADAAWSAGRERLGSGALLETDHCASGFESARCLLLRLCDWVGSGDEMVVRGIDPDPERPF